MIYALLALGHSLQSSMIQKAIAGITSYMWKMESGNHVQNSPSTVWDTALLSYALQEAHVLKDNKMLQNATAYLLKKQHTKKADWSV
ncbi:squalene--hopene cyclase, partial [Bacillus cereus]